MVFEVDGLGVDLGGRAVLSDVRFSIERGERVVLLGVNGWGGLGSPQTLANDQRVNIGEEFAPNRHVLGGGRGLPLSSAIGVSIRELSGRGARPAARRAPVHTAPRDV